MRARKDLTQETKDLHDATTMKNYGSLDYNEKTGSFNRIKDFSRDLKSEIVDENAFITEVGKSFEYQRAKENGGGVRVGDMKGVDSKVLYTSSNSITERDAGRVKDVMTSELAAKDYHGSRKQIYEMRAEMGDFEYTEEGAIMTPDELATRDENSLIARSKVI